MSYKEKPGLGLLPKLNTIHAVALKYYIKELLNFLGSSTVHTAYSVY